MAHYKKNANDEVVLVADSTSTATNKTVAVATSSTAVLSANADRIGMVFTNVSDTTITITFGATATANNGIPLAAGAGVVPPAGYTGVVTAIHGGSGTKTLSVVEF